MSKNKQTTEAQVSLETPETLVVTPVARTYAQLIEQYKTKSGVIRGLHAEGMDTKTIHKTLTEQKVMNEKGTHPLRYQHVRNVLQTIVKKAS